MAITALFVAACGAEIFDSERAGNSPDAATTSGPDATDPSTTMPDGGTSVLAACLAKGYTTVTGLTSVYRAGAGNQKWLAAGDDCNADVAGATHLVVLSSTAEADYIRSHLGWIGLSDSGTEGTFRNVTEEPGDLRPFSSGQPDNGGGNENCVQMKSDGLDDDQCDNSHAYVCECDGRAPVP